MKKIKIHPIFILFITIIYLELMFKYIMFKNIFNIGLLYTFIFIIPIVILLTLFTKLFNKIINKIVTILITLIITIYYIIQYVYYTLFSVPLSFSSIGMADQALDFTVIIKDTLIAHWQTVLLMLIPFILVCIIIKKIDNDKYTKLSKISLLIMFITSYLLTFLTLIPSKNEDYSNYKLYNNIDDASSIINKFGILTYTKIDIKRQLFGYEQTLVIEPDVEEIIIESEEIKELGFNEIEKDFSTMPVPNNTIATLNEYISQQQPTNKNQYTGMFEGKNLIFILAEGFNEIAVDETRTPTLYKLTTNGFVFNNFYSPVYLSTTGGEFQATTGLIPTQEILSLWKGKTPTIEYALGNSFSELGYRIQSYHDWTYTYYKRHVTMQTLGFYNYIGCGNGLEQRQTCTWLPSDIDMVNVTTPDYLNQEGNFVTYYVTVSGHSPYAPGDNIARRYISMLDGTNYSTQVRYYLAAQVELDKMLEQLIANLEESGELDNTVIALVGDHYPYTLSTEEMNEASDYYKDGIIEVNRSNFILWNNQIEEPIIIDKVGSQIDVLPTLLNLFGIEYDSRTIVGKDILSEYPGIAIFSNRSWVTDKGSYYTNSGKFVPKEGVEFESDEEKLNYIRSINARVSNSFSISKMLIESNYYEYFKNN